VTGVHIPEDREERGACLASSGGHSPTSKTSRPNGAASTPSGFHWSLALIGLCMFTFAAVTYKLPIGEAGIIVALLGLLTQRDRVRLPVIVWLFGAFELWALVASFGSQYPEVARNQLLDQAKLGLIVVVAVNALRTKGQLRAYILFFLACFTLFPARGTLVNYALGNHPFGRAIWNYIYNNSNDVAALSLLALGVAMAVVLAEFERTIVKIAAGVSAILFFVVILLTQSRGVFIGLVVAAAPALLAATIRRPRRAVYAVLAAAAIIVSTPASVWQRYAGIGKVTSASTIADADPEHSAAERFEIQKIAWRIFVDHPVFGVGLGAYPRANAMYSPELGRRDTHNTYLNLAAELGLPGLGLWSAMGISALSTARRSRRVNGPSASGIEQVWIERAIIGYFVAGAFGSYAKLTFPYLMLAILWCCATVASEGTARHEPAPVMTEGRPLSRWPSRNQ
jgi:O-antigen ligase